MDLAKLIKKSSIFISLLIFFIANYGFATSRKVYPVILVHGITGSFQGWINDGNVPGFLNPYYDCYADRNSHYQNQGGIPYNRLNSDYNVFGINYSKPNGSIEDNAIELDRAINGYNGQDGIRQIMSKSYPEVFPTPDDVKIVIIAHSMGGLSSRKYIQDHPNSHHVAKLITLGTPHLGSGLSDFSKLYSDKNRIEILSASQIAIGILLGWLTPWGAWFWVNGAMLLTIEELTYNNAINSRIPFSVGGIQMIPDSKFLKGLNSGETHTIFIPSNLDYRFIIGIQPWFDSYIGGLMRGAGMDRAVTDGDMNVSPDSSLAINGLQNYYSLPIPISYILPLGTPLVNSKNFICNKTFHAKETKDGLQVFHGGDAFTLLERHEEILKALEDPPLISNVSYFTFDNQPLQNNSLLDVTKPEVKVTGSLWDYLLNKLGAKISFSHKLPQSIDFDTFGYFCETTTLAAGGKNSVFVSASNPANYYSSSSPHNIYLVGISFPRDEMVLTPENSSQFQYSVLGSTGEVITTEAQSLSFGDYGGALPEKIIDLPQNARRLSQPQYLNGDNNPDISFLDENGVQLQPDESGNYNVQGKTKFKAKLKNDYEGRTFVKLQGNADAVQWSTSEIRNEF